MTNNKETIFYCPSNRKKFKTKDYHIKILSNGARAAVAQCPLNHPKNKRHETFKFVKADF